MKKRYIKSFFITLFIYFIVFILIFSILHNKKSPKFQQPEKIRLNIKNIEFYKQEKKDIVQKIVKKSRPQKSIKKVSKREKKVIKKVVKSKKIKKSVNLDQNRTVKVSRKVLKSKKIKKPKTLDQNKTEKTAKKEIKKNIKKTYQKLFKKSKPISKPKIVKKEKNRKKETKNNSLLSFLKKPDIPSLSQIGKNIKMDEIKTLYQGEFESFTKGQKKFIEKNLSLIGKITQKYLNIRGYPDFAVKTGQEGINIVEFYLHPNGDITELKIIKSSGYTTLDKNSIETIKSAYKDYPRPKETTKIRIFVHYKIIY